MATLLDGVNRVLTRTGILKKTSQLTSLTDSSIQNYIDTAIDNWNEVIDRLYEINNRPHPKEIRSATITLKTGVREYSLHSKLTAFRIEYHLIDETNNHVITFKPDAHRALVFADIEQDDTGLPHLATINPENGRLLFDRAPTSDDNGNIYKYRYERDLEMDEAGDEFPFKDKVFRALVPAVAEKWKFEHQGGGSDAIFRSAMSEAAGYLRRVQKRHSWTPIQPGTDHTDPFDAAHVR